MKTEKRVGQRVADLAEGSSLHVGNMKIEGLLASIADDLPSLKEKGVWLVDPTALDPQEKKNLVLRLLAYSPFINTNLVKSPETPRTWKDLLDPKWKGKMTLTEPNVSAGPYETIVVLMENKIWDEDYLKALYKQGLRFPASTPDEFSMLARGESSIVIRGTDASASRFVTEGAPIQAIAMKEGEVVSTGSIGAIAGSPSPNAAKTLLNWLYSKEGLTVAGKALGNKMIRNDVPDTRPKGIQTDSDKPLVVSLDNLDTATQLFR
ncbi:MAG: extracellular solute-binding protein family 1, partial [Dehalococcoidia bacterium]|nr:extracellular solute-binding protein family 1 [Dehalococcoidia bacterium]